MPWRISRQGQKFAVVNEATGASEGESATLEEAKKHLAALYANEPKADSVPDDAPVVTIATVPVDQLRPGDLMDGDRVAEVLLDSTDERVMVVCRSGSSFIEPRKATRNVALSVEHGGQTLLRYPQASRIDWVPESAVRQDAADNAFAEGDLCYACGSKRVLREDKRVRCLDCEGRRQRADEYIGWDAMVEKLMKEGHDEESAKKIAASIAREKYGPGCNRGDGLPPWLKEKDEEAAEGEEDDEQEEGARKKKRKDSAGNYTYVVSAPAPAARPVPKTRGDAVHKTTSVRRYDVLERLDGPSLLPNGWLKVDAAHIARTGIQEYKRGDGSVRREYRPPEEVFDAEALDSFKMLPVTDDHPPDGLLTAENCRQYQRGHLGETVTQDGNKIKAPILITDADLVQKVLNGKSQLSGGYVCDLEETPGEIDGQRFDCIQRKIRGNHVAVVAKARGGPELRLKLDSGDAVSIRADREQEAPLAEHSTSIRRTDMAVKLTLDGIEVEVANEQGAQLIGRALTSRDQRADAAEKALRTFREDAEKGVQQNSNEKDQLRARATVAEQKVAELEKARKDAEEALPNLIKARLQLMEQARDVLGPEAKFDNLDEQAIKKTVITKMNPNVKLDGESEAFVNGVYTSCLATKAEIEAGRSVAAARALVMPRNDGGPLVDSEAARMKARKDHEEEWKKPLSASK